ncbi:hypothetical protein IGX29_05055 [Streptomyces sp. H28]|uniref:hypothetical protein n=1 Tax=Streptomyces sp. H28 TaxID=2775865 RepID=UPI00177EBB1C|nr:hypothetical protein [Streptomyces sp. H28]MBD9731195.1 hypothetical protein [Streptomyces sp. H28]
MSPADRAFVALADHSIHCHDCRPDLERPTPERRPECPLAQRLYRSWNRVWRMERRTT